ncbi:hypothetical protein BDP55DRAFT_636601 [Colletotrichum godetiae]|uniref:Uncharacterized protein n=1 Tax=Colletotrichum godetiae TaxID=1209918 RepID=A0AAJ0ESP6_9PEZI|nr:uncharacterized protein BDP55DRAFT_636601 [Colletotrichum godetiae]KAK1659764.1 hypothetical protein BDP55DRAFT_636601 [Colletotrichum godetiae]
MDFPIPSIRLSRYSLFLSGVIPRPQQVNNGRLRGKPAKLSTRNDEGDVVTVPLTALPYIPEKEDIVSFLDEWQQCASDLRKHLIHLTRRNNPCCPAMRRLQWTCEQVLCRWEACFRHACPGLESPVESNMALPDLRSSIWDVFLEEGAFEATAD